MIEWTTLFDGETEQTLASSSFKLQEVVESGLIPGRWVKLTDVDGIAVVAEVCLRLKYQGTSGGRKSSSAGAALRHPCPTDPCTTGMTRRP